MLLRKTLKNKINKSLLILSLVFIHGLAITFESYASNREGNTLKMVTAADMPPYTFVKNKEILGFEVDLGRYITNRIAFIDGFEGQFFLAKLYPFKSLVCDENMKCMNVDNSQISLPYSCDVNDIDYGTIINKLKKGSFDFAITGMSPTEERKKVIEFSKSYNGGTYCLVINKSLFDKNYAHDKKTLFEAILSGNIGMQTGDSDVERIIVQHFGNKGTEIIKINDLTTVFELTGKSYDFSLMSCMACQLMAENFGGSQKACVNLNYEMDSLFQVNNSEGSAIAFRDNFLYKKLFNSNLDFVLQVSNDKYNNDYEYREYEKICAKYGLIVNKGGDDKFPKVSLDKDAKYSIAAHNAINLYNKIIKTFSLKKYLYDNSESLTADFVKQEIERIGGERDYSEKKEALSKILWIWSLSDGSVENPNYTKVEQIFEDEFERAEFPNENAKGSTKDMAQSLLCWFKNAAKNHAAENHKQSDDLLMKSPCVSIPDNFLKKVCTFLYDNNPSFRDIYSILYEGAVFNNGPIRDAVFNAEELPSSEYLNEFVPILNYKELNPEINQMSLDIFMMILQNKKASFVIMNDKSSHAVKVESLMNIYKDSLPDNIGNEAKFLGLELSKIWWIVQGALPVLIVAFSSFVMSFIIGLLLILLTDILGKCSSETLCRKCFNLKNRDRCKACNGNGKLVIKMAKVKYCLVFIIEKSMSTIRGIPFLLQLLFCYYNIPKWITYEKGLYLAAILTCTLNSTAYVYAIFEGSMRSISKGQMEAAKVLRISNFDFYLKIIFKKLMKISLPSLINELMSLTKETGLLSLIGFMELTKRARLVAGESLNPYGPLFISAICYLTITNIILYAEKQAEKKFITLKK